MNLDQIIHNSFILFLALTIITKITLLLLNIKHVKLNLASVPLKFREKIDLESHQKAGKYTITKNYFNLFTILLNTVILLFWLEAGALGSLNSFIAGYLSDYSPVSIGVALFIVFNLVNTLLSIPESLYSTFVIEEKFGFNKVTAKIFIVDFLKQLILSLVIMIPLLYGVFYLLYSAGTLWWLYTWASIIVFQFVLIWAYPKFIAPLFNKFSPLSDEELEVKIKTLTDSTKIPFKDYFVMNASLRSSHGNAYFTGFGKNKRIVFFDTLLKTLNANEVVAVLAHELGHLKKKHIMKSICISSLLMLLGLYFLGQIYQEQALFNAFKMNTSEPYMAMLIFTMIIPYYLYFLTPLSSLLSRKNEFEADYFAAQHANADDLITALIKMYKDNSSTLTPHPIYSKFYFSHPPANERVTFLEGLIKE